MTESLGNLVKVKIRNRWPNEAADFTPSRVASQKVLPVPYSLQQLLPTVRFRFYKRGRDHVERTTVKLIAILKL